MELDLSQWRRAAGVIREGFNQDTPLWRRTALRVTLDVSRKAAFKAPKREGPLRQSATATVELRGVGLMGIVQFGGLSEAYASVQHEHEEFRHGPDTGDPRSDPGGQAKYLYGRDDSAWSPEQERVSSDYVAAQIAAGMEAAL